MTYNRFFVPCFLLIASYAFTTTERLVLSQNYSHKMPVNVIDAKGNRTVQVPVNMQQFYAPKQPAQGGGNTANCTDPNHVTLKGANGGRPFWHLHIENRSFPTVITDDLGNEIDRVTAESIRAYWDWEMPLTVRGQNSSKIESGGSENITYNCYAHAFGGRYSDIWIQGTGANTIFTDDYQSTVWLVKGLIRLSDRVLVVTDVTYEENVGAWVTGTSEKNQHSGIYNMEYPVYPSIFTSAVFGNSVYNVLGMTSFYDKKP